MSTHQRGSEYVVYRHEPIHRLRLLMAGHRNIQEWREPMVMARSHLLLTYVYAGQGTVDEQPSQTIGPGDWYVLFPGEVIFVSTDRKDPWQYFWLGLDGEDALQIMQQAGLTPQSRIRHTRRPAQTKQGFEHLLKHLASKTLADQLAANRFLWQLLGELIPRHHTPPLGNASHPADTMVNRASQIMQHQYQSGITASQVADALGMDRSYLSTRFAQVMGMTMRDYLQRLRINRAQILLRHSELSVSQIACAVGYREYRSFIRCYRLVTGQTPRQYARTIREDVHR
jgi:AraC-like DNA-binding protein